MRLNNTAQSHTFIPRNKGVQIQLHGTFFYVCNISNFETFHNSLLNTYTMFDKLFITHTKNCLKLNSTWISDLQIHNKLFLWFKKITSYLSTLRIFQYRKTVIDNNQKHSPIVITRWMIFKELTELKF